MTHPPIVMRRRLKAPPARVFEALINPELIRQWMCPESLTVAFFENEPVIGGNFRIGMRKSDGIVFIAAGVYREIDAPRRLVFSWMWEEQHEAKGIETEIVVELAPEGDDTRFVMTHFGLPTEEERRGHESGWNSGINKLERMFS